MREFFKAIQKADVSEYRRLLEQDGELAHATIVLQSRLKKADRVLQSTPLHKAVGEFKFYGIMDKRRSGHLEIARDLLHRGADPTVRGSQLHVDALCSAAMAGHAEAVPVLRDHGARLNLCQAAVLGEVAVVNAVDDEVIDEPDENGLTPLLYCSASRLGVHDEVAAGNLAEVAQTLIRRGARVDGYWPGCHGSIESHLLPTSFASMGNLSVLEVLLDHNAPISEPTSPGANGTALAHATWSRCAPCLNLLIKRCSGGADGEEGCGFTPYHWIARTGWPETAVDLINFIAKKRFVNINTVSDNGQTAHDIAQEFGRKKIARALNSL